MFRGRFVHVEKTMRCVLSTLKNDEGVSTHAKMSEFFCPRCVLSVYYTDSKMLYHMGGLPSLRQDEHCHQLDRHVPAGYRTRSLRIAE